MTPVLASLSSRLRERPRAPLWAALALGLVVTAAAAAQPAGPPNAVQGFSQNRNQPIQIQSASLELREKEKIATFSDNVHLVQGDTTLECKKLVVHYGDDSSAGSPAPGAKGAAGPKTASIAGGAAMGGPQQIQKLEALGGVVVTQKDQTATGDSGLFDMKTNSVTLIGNVVVTQGQNVLRGDRLWVDLNTGVSRVESGGPGGAGRVQGLFLPSSAPDVRPAAERPPGGTKAAPKAGGGSRPPTGAAAPGGPAGATGSAGGSASPATTGTTSPARPGAGKDATRPAASRPAAPVN